jgi:hypothetical protein
MSRMLFLVPRMYTENEFRDLASTIPQDFGPKTFEFWSYVEDKLKAFVGKIQRVYRDEICEGGEKALTHLSTIDRESFMIAKKLVDGGAVFEATEDSMLVAEWASWFEAVRHNPLDRISLEMLQETVRERGTYVSRRIDETLQDEETGILFVKPDLTVNVNGRDKVIRVCRFDPADYLRSWQIQLETKP